MKKLTAIYRMEQNGVVKGMVRDDYKSKAKLRSDLQANGFRVVEIFTEEQVNEIKTMTGTEIFEKVGYQHKHKEVAYRYVQEVILEGQR